MTRRSRTILSYRSSPTYIAPKGVYHRPKNVREYTIIPTGYPKLRMTRDADGNAIFTSKTPIPQGMVDISDLQGPKVRQYSDGFLMTRFNRNTSITMRQNYVRKVLSNPRTPEYNRNYLLDFMSRNPGMFEPAPEIADYGERYLESVRFRNGSDPEFGFVERILRSQRGVL